MTTPVIFRTFRNTGDVIALFPTIPHDPSGLYMMSYQHVGQHGAASPLLTQQHTRPATEEEKAPLRRELVRIGYNDLKEIRRRTYKHDKQRFAP